MDFAVGGASLKVSRVLFCRGGVIHLKVLPQTYIPRWRGQVEADSRHGRWGSTLPLFPKFTETRELR